HGDLLRRPDPGPEPARRRALRGPRPAGAPGVSQLSLVPGSREGAELMQRVVKGRSLWDDALRRLLRNRMAMASALLLMALVAAALVGPLLLPFTYDQINKNDVWLPPLDGGHLLGSDSLGRDLLARLLVGMRVSLAIGVVATAVSL